MLYNFSGSLLSPFLCCTITKLLRDSIEVLDLRHSEKKFATDKLQQPV